MIDRYILGDQEGYLCMCGDEATHFFVWHATDGAEKFCNTIGKCDQHLEGYENGQWKKLGYPEEHWHRLSREEIDMMAAVYDVHNF